MLPEAWQRLHDVNAKMSSLLSPFQQYADVNRMDEQQLNEHLDMTDFFESQKEAIRKAVDRSKVYQELVTRFALSNAYEAFDEFNQYSHKNSIFMPSEIREKFEEAAKILSSAAISKEVGMEAKDFKMQREGWTELNEKFEPLYQDIKSAIQERLRQHGVFGESVNLLGVLKMLEYRTVPSKFEFYVLNQNPSFN